MPKEQGHFGERVGRNASKNAKDKSNSATVRADRGHRGQASPGTLGGMGDMGERLSRFDSGKDSEKDSGYSEAGSDSVQNDLDDQRSSVSQTHRKNGRSAVTVGNHGSSGVGRVEEHSPVYVIKNLVVKPSRQEQMLHRPLEWAGGWHSLSGPKGPTQLLLIQQPAVTAPSSSSSFSSSSTLTTYSAPAETLSKANKKVCISRTSGKNHHHHHSATKNSYLPILNSYPRIAPHPRKEGHAQGKSSGAPAAGKEGGGGGGVGGSGGEGQSQSKRVCTEEELKRESVSTTTRHPSSHHHHGRHRDLHHSQHKVRRGSETPAHPSPASRTKNYRRSHHSSCSDALGSLSVSSSQMPSLPSHSSSSSHSPSSSSSSSSSCPTSYSSSSVTHSPYRPRQGRAGSVVAAAAAAASGHLSDSPSECSSVRQRRFLNTAEILSQSGLLAITLRTKELQKQSDTTEREIAQLRHHTQLLCQAALAGQQVPNDGSNCLQRLLQAMAQSGSYPGLDSSAQAKAIGDNRKQSERRGEAAIGESREADEQGRAKNGPQHQHLVSLQGADEGVSPPSPLFALSPEEERMEQVNSLAGSLSMDKDLTDLAMSPESYTFDNYLF